MTYYYTLRHSLTENQPCRNMPRQGIPVCLNYLWSSVYALPDCATLLFVNLSCKITKNPTLLPVDFKPRDSDTD